MKVLITGGAGFIGSHVSTKLVSMGEDVVVIDNFDTFYDPREKQRNINTLIKKKNFTLIKADIIQKEKIKKIFTNKKFDIVIHLAAKAGVRPSILDPVSYAQTNILGTLNLLDAAREFGIKNFIFGSSSSVYGERSDKPFSESDVADSPISPYGLTKLAGEKTCFVYNNLYSIPITCLRFFTVYGPAQRPDLAIRKFMSLISKGKSIEIYGGGDSKRDYTYVSDIVDGVIKAYKTPRNFEIINLGNSNPVKLSKLVGLIEEKLGKKSKIKKLPEQAGDVTNTFANISKAKKLLDWEPKVNIREGLSKMSDWFNEYN